jgi:hypothetical protein
LRVSDQSVQKALALQFIEQAKIQERRRLFLSYITSGDSVKELYSFNTYETGRGMEWITLTAKPPPMAVRKTKALPCEGIDLYI